MRIPLFLVVNLILVYSCNNQLDKKESEDEVSTVVEEVEQILKDTTSYGTMLTQADLWSPLNSDPNPRLYITAHFSECGEWGGHFEELTVSIDESHQPNVYYERNMVKCDSVDSFTGFPYQILDYRKHVKLNSNGKKSIEDYISRLIRSKIGERYPGHAGDVFKIVNHDSTLLVVVYDYKPENVKSYNQLLEELMLDKAID